MSEGPIYGLGSMYGMKYNDPNRPRIMNHFEGRLLDRNYENIDADIERTLRNPLKHGLGFRAQRNMPRFPTNLTPATYLKWGTEMLQYLHDKQDDFVEDILCYEDWLILLNNNMHAKKILQRENGTQFVYSTSFENAVDMKRHAIETNELELFNQSTFEEEGASYLQFAFFLGDPEGDYDLLYHRTAQGVYRNWIYKAELDNLINLFEQKYDECALRINDLCEQMPVRLLSLMQREAWQKSEAFKAQAREWIIKLANERVENRQRENQVNFSVMLAKKFWNEHISPDDKYNLQQNINPYICQID